MICLSSWGSAAQDRTGTISISNTAAQLKDPAKSAWERNFFEGDEIWILENIDTFFKAIEAAGLHPELARDLRNLVRPTTLSQESFIAVLPFYGFSYQDAQGVLFVPELLKAKMSSQVLLAIYTYLVETHHPPPNTRVRSAQNMEDFFKGNELTGTALRLALTRTYKIDDSYYFFYTPDIWPTLTYQMKVELINAHINPTSRDSSRLGLRVSLSYSKDDDLDAIASKFAGERDGRPIAKYLRLKLKKSKSGFVTIPLESILHAFIRKNVNTFAECSGPNCFNSGTSVNEKNNYTKEFISESTLMDKLNRQYRVVGPGEALQAGDLFLYSKALPGGKEWPTHVATYVMDGILYTKNGIGKFNPYLYQERQRVEKAYFPDGKFKLTVYRTLPHGCVMTLNKAG